MNKIFKSINNLLLVRFPVIVNTDKSSMTYITLSKEILLRLLVGTIFSIVTINASAEANLKWGDDATAEGVQSIAIGKKATVKPDNGIAMGQGASVADVGSQFGIAVGFGATVTVDSNNPDIPQGHGVVNTGGVAIGYNSKTTEMNTIAIGSGAEGGGLQAVAIGRSTRTKANNAIAVGNESSATKKQAIAMGNRANAAGDNALAMGNNANAGKDAAVAIGNDSISSGLSAVAVGNGTKAIGNYSYAVSNGAKAEGNFSMAVGAGAVAAKYAGVALGMSSKASAAAATAIGVDTIAGGESSVSIGQSSQSAGKRGVGVGYMSRASGEHSVAIGQTVISSAMDSIAVGSDSNAGGESAIAIGSNSVASNATAIAMGKRANALDSASIAFGVSANASGQNALALGQISVANLKDGVALGSESKTTTDKGVVGYNVATSSVRANSYAQLTGNVLTSTLAGLSVGNENNTRQINHVAAGTADDDAVNVAQLRNVNLKIAGNISENGGRDDVLLDSQILTVKGEGNYIATKASGQTIIADLTQSTKDKIGNAADKNFSNITEDAENVIKQTAAWKLKANDETDTETISGGDTVTIKKGKNTTVIRSGKGITIATEDDVDFSSVNAGGTKISNDGLAFVDTNGNQIMNSPTVAKSGIDAGNKKITNVAAGTNDTDAVNYKQLKDMQAAAGKMTTVIEGKNITVTESTNAQGGREYTVGLKDVVTLGTDGNAIALDGSKGLIKAGENGNSITIDGTKGHIKAGDGLNAVEIDGTKGLIKAGEGGNAVIVDGTKGQIKAGDGLNAVDIDGTKGLVKAGNGDNAVAIDGTKGQIKAGDKITIDGAAGTINGLTNKTWDPSAIRSGRAATEDQLKVVDDNVTNLNSKVNNLGWNVTSATDGGKVDGTTVEKVKSDDMVTFKAGDNLSLKQDGKNFTYSLQKDLSELNSINVGHLGKDGVSITGSDAIAGFDGKVAIAGQNGKDAVSMSSKDGVGHIGLTGPTGANGQTTIDISTDKGAGVLDNASGKDDRIVYSGVNQAGQTVMREVATMDDGLNFVGDDGKVVAKKLNQQLKIAGGAKGKLAENNIGVKTDDNGNLNVQLAEELKGLNSVETKTLTSMDMAGDTTIVNGAGVTVTPVGNSDPKNVVSMTTNGISAGSKQVTHVASGGNVDTNGANIGDIKRIAAQNAQNIAGNIYKDMRKVNREARAGIAGANAAASLPQAYIPGKSMVAAAGGTFKGQNAFAVGYSRSSDNGKVILKLQGNANTQGDVGGGVGVGYQCNLTVL